MKSDKSGAFVITEPHEVEARLRKLHPTLRVDLLLEALRAGMVERAHCTNHHPATYPGSVMYGESTRMLRDLLTPLRWAKQSTKNFETSVSPDRKMAIVIASGDEWTGTKSQTHKPTTRHEKGLVTRRAVKRNRQGVLPFLPSDKAANVEVFSDDPGEEEVYQTTWFLLHCIVGGDLRAELSQPTEIDETGKIRQWSVRLVLDSIPLDSDAMPVTDDEPIEPVVEMRRRGN